MPRPNSQSFRGRFLSQDNPSARITSEDKMLTNSLFTDYVCLVTNAERRLEERRRKKGERKQMKGGRGGGGTRRRRY